MEEQQLRNEMLFTLSDRDTGTVALVVTGNERQRKELIFFLKEHLSEYKFFDVDLTPHNYTSLHRALTELLPQEIQAATATEWLINITGLENALYRTPDGNIEFSIVDQLNFERELLFKQPQILMLWISKSFYVTLRKNAPDLMHWLSKRFIFNVETMSPEIAEEAFEKGAIKQQGNITKRTDRISELNSIFERLCLDHDDKLRLIKDKINILLLLGKEYREAFDFEHSEEALLKALSLNNKLNWNEKGDIAFELGNTYLQFNKLDKALIFYNLSLTENLSQKKENNVGTNYHKLGIVYAEKRNWALALENYQKAIEWKTKTGNDFELGDTYHQVGMVFEEQRNWPLALENYQKAIKWKTKTGDDLELGGTYHQVGMVYAEQRNWPLALQHYQKAIEWSTKTGNEFELGGTYHQVGMVYEEQRNWPLALQHYQKAIDWNTKTGNEFQLGGTCHHVGIVYAEQRNWPLALKHYQKAIEWNTKTGNVFQLGRTYHQIGRVYEEQSAFKQAKEYYLMSKANFELYDTANIDVTLRSLQRIEEKIQASGNT